MKTQLVNAFNRLYQASSDQTLRLFFAPGRVNLIGEHIDYNGGHVMPCAIEQGTYLVVRLREDDAIRLYSENFSEAGISTYHLKEAFKANDHWTDYVLGVLEIYRREQHAITCGFDLYCYGNIPNGAGLSSSSSLEIALITMLNTCFAITMTLQQKVQLAQRVENEFIKVNTGIMDQFIIAKGRADQAILLNSKDLNYRYIPFEQSPYQLIIGNTNYRRGLADSKYNERFEECQASLQLLQRHFDIAALCDLSISQLDNALSLLDDATLRRRVRHVISENHRTLTAAAALQRADYIKFGRLMGDSHCSLKYDYEVTGDALDSLVDAASQHHAVIGARMTGAGFGGCMIALVKRQFAEQYCREVGQIYRERMAMDADFYWANAADGAREIALH